MSDPSQDLDNDVRELLNTIMNHENIPRKRAKFMNFVKNIKRGIRPATIDKTWEFFEQALKPKKVEEAKPSNDEPLKNDEAQNVTQSKKDKKKKKKAIQDDDDLDNSRQGVKMFEGIQEKENNGTASENGDGSGGKKKKKKKSKLAEEVNNLENETSEKNGTKRKRENEDEGEEQPESKRAHSEKFVWEDVVVKILEKKGDMKLNKLKKKVVAEYMSQLGETHKSEETLRVKVDKTLKKSRRFKTLKDVVSLVD